MGYVIVCLAMNISSFIDLKIVCIGYYLLFSQESVRTKNINHKTDISYHQHFVHRPHDFPKNIDIYTKINKNIYNMVHKVLIDTDIMWWVVQLESTNQHSLCKFNKIHTILYTSWNASEFIPSIPSSVMRASPFTQYQSQK